MAPEQSVYDKAVFVGGANAHHSEWLEAVFLLIGMDVMLLILVIYRVANSWCDMPVTLLVTELIL